MFFFLYFFFFFLGGGFRVLSLKVEGLGSEELVYGFVDERRGCLEIPTHL